MPASIRNPTLAMLFACAFGMAMEACADTVSNDTPPAVQQLVDRHCLDCHGGADAEAGRDLSSLSFDLQDQATFDGWVQIHDRIRRGEMPPPEGVPQPLMELGMSVAGKSSHEEELTPVTFRGEAKHALHQLGRELAASDTQRIQQHGRAKVRRVNRFEYENTMRALLRAPWLQVAHQLPEDGVADLFNKSGEQLDVSHVQMTQYLTTARNALRVAVNSAAHRSQTRKFYAREESSMRGYLHYRLGQRAATRAIVPLLGLTPEPEIIRKAQPVSVGAADPSTRELEAMGVFSGVYSATTKYDFNRINAPTDGRYRLRFKTYTFMAGPNGADAGDDHGLTGGKRAWWRPDRNVASIGIRSEPVTLYALSSGGDSRWLTTFDSHPEPSVFECVVQLRRGEGIRPDAARLVRTRPGWSGNPNSTQAGVPGFAMNWLEVAGPLNDEWPPASYQSVFGNLPFEVANGEVRALPGNADEDARRLIQSFCRRAWHASLDGKGPEQRNSDIGAEAKPNAPELDDIGPFLAVYHNAIELGEDFTDALVASLSAVLCSPKFLYFDARPGKLSESDFKLRLTYFLLNGPPRTHSSMASINLSDPTSIRQSVERMLHDAESDRFVNAFLDYWLDLRDINANTPDAQLYPNYYLDELLTESSVLETRRFFRKLIEHDLPVRNLVDAKFAFVNERLAEHYDLPPVSGVRIRRVELPVDSPRGGLLTQASVLRVTANGTTTSPVVRGAWVMERIMGMEIPAPPSGIAAVEPDIRGAQTIREQLQKHRSDESCNACHARFDPAGFALESFDVTGGWRTRYRAIDDVSDDVSDVVEGIGKNGHAFSFRLGQPVDCSGSLEDGRTFGDIKELKRLLVSDERQLARNLTRRLLVYATGAPIRFGDRAEIERILDKAKASEFGVRSLIHEIVQSKLFSVK